TPQNIKKIKFDQVSFAYVKNKPVLQEISFSIQPNSITALIGDSGSGKTTVIDLICGLLSSQSGGIYVNDKPLEHFSMSAWRKQIGYVAQDLFLFHDTVYRNVTLGDLEISRSQVEKALRGAGAWQFITELENGLDTVIGERGMLLSGGQRQRISIARALVRDPQLLILDEATTALDPQTEEAILETLLKLKKNMMIFSISHQPALVEVADYIYRLSNKSISLVKVKDKATA
ncbi:MAG: hypothetical protein COB67_04160, partial [SAR324 cluster bacterium]